MSKGYMIFVEGMNEPKCVYADFAEAHKDAHALALKYRGKAVSLLQIHKRIVMKPKKTDAEKLPAHIPPNTEKKRLGLSDLVFRNNINDTNSLSSQV